MSEPVELWVAREGTLATGMHSTPPSVAEVVEWLKPRVDLRAVVNEAVRLIFSDEEMTLGEIKDRAWAVVSDEAT